MLYSFAHWQHLAKYHEYYVTRFKWNLKWTQYTHEPIKSSWVNLIANFPQNECNIALATMSTIYLKSYTANCILCVMREWNNLIYRIFGSIFHWKLILHKICNLERYWIRLERRIHSLHQICSVFIITYPSRKKVTKGYKRTNMNARCAVNWIHFIVSQMFACCE